MVLLSFQLALLKSIRKPHMKASVQMLCTEAQAKGIPDLLLHPRLAFAPWLLDGMFVFQEDSPSVPRADLTEMNGWACCLPWLWPKLETGNRERWSWSESVAFSLSNWNLSLPQRPARLRKSFKGSPLRVATVD